MPRIHMLNDSAKTQHEMPFPLRMEKWRRRENELRVPVAAVTIRGEENRHQT